METIRLPAHLGDRAECARLNVRLREGSIALDFQEVVSTDSGALAALLAGITVDTIPDGLGIDGIPSALEGQVELVLRANAAAPPVKKPKKKKPAPKAAPAAAIWK